MGRLGKSSTLIRLEEQVEIMGTPRVSLHSLWREAGRPPELSPEHWLMIAASLVEGIERYRAALPLGSKAFPADIPLLERRETDGGEPWRLGDVVAHEVIARVYVFYLDELVGPGDSFGGFFREES